MPQAPKHRNRQNGVVSRPRQYRLLVVRRVSPNGATLVFETALNRVDPPGPVPAMVAPEKGLEPVERPNISPRRWVYEAGEMSKLRQLFADFIIAGPVQLEEPRPNALEVAGRPKGDRGAP